MRRFLAVALLSSPAFACDWTLSEEVDPMTDERVCIITSASAKMGIGVVGEKVTFLTGSPYTEDYLQVRVDDREAVQMYEDSKSTGAFKDNARRALAEIQTGKRLRTAYKDYPDHVTGDAPICNLPELIKSCQSPPASDPESATPK